MKHNVLTTLLVGLLLTVVGVSQVWADNQWTHVAHNTGYCNKTTQNYRSYNDLNGSHWNTVTYKSNIKSSTYGDLGYTHVGNTQANTIQMMMAYYSMSETIPSYAKLKRACTFLIYACATYNHNSTGIYMFDTESAATTTKLDASQRMEETKPTGYLKHIENRNCDGNKPVEATTSTDLIMNNSNSSSAKSFSKYLVFITCIGAGTSDENGTRKGSWKQTAVTDTWYYYKYITFNANQGTGTAMAQQTIENSGNLKANTYTRTGYLFTGWNTAADGSGTAYTNGGSITATSTDKGPITLYAQWVPVESLLQPLAIDPNTFNGNCIFGQTETRAKSGVDLAGGCAFYSNNCTDITNLHSNYVGHGLPDAGLLTIPDGNGINVPFQLAWTGSYPYDGKDAIHLTAANAAQTVNLNNGNPFQKLYFCATAGGVGTGAAIIITVTVTYSDNTTSSGNFSMLDWYQNPLPGHALHGYYRYDLNYPSSGSSIYLANQGPNFYCFSLSSVLNTEKSIKSITFQHASTSGNMKTAIFAITGMQASSAPSAPTNATASYTATTTTLEWDEVTTNVVGESISGVTYKYDVASDVNFNSLIVTNQDLSGTLTSGRYSTTLNSSYSDKYIRIRAVKSGQASQNVIVRSAAVTDGTGANYDDAKTEVNTKLTTWKASCSGSQTISLTIHRTIYKDGYFNTLCLPFDLDADQIADAFVGEPQQLKQFVSASVQGTGDDREIIIETKDTTGIKAGKAYLISFENGENLTELTFLGVSVTKTTADVLSGDLYYQGILAPYQIPSEEQYLFVGDANRLYWPKNDGTFLRGFRAYFKVTGGTVKGAPVKRGMKASFGTGKTVPTSNDNVNVNDTDEIKKLIEEGRVVIKTNGVKYDMNGRKL